MGRPKRATPPSEFVVQRNGQVRHAGATTADDLFVRSFKTACEESLYILAVGVLGYTFLTEHLHRPICDWLQKCPPKRKLLLMPREHGKTTMAPRALPIHMWIQPAETNVYFPGESGANTRILLAGETEAMAKGNLRVVRTHMEGNELLRALWPHLMWQNHNRDPKVWNDSEIIIRRPIEYAESSLDAVGVGGARTGKHPNVLLKDDITTEAAANSPIIMQTAKDWHVNSRALCPHGLEFTTGTYWTPDDLPHDIERDPSVAVNKRFRAIVEQDKLIWPEHMSFEDVTRLQREYGPRFFLLYMNTVTDSALTDFDVSDLRFFEMEGETLTFGEDERDGTNTWNVSRETPFERDTPDLRGSSLYDRTTQEVLRQRAYRLRAR